MVNPSLHVSSDYQAANERLDAIKQDSDLLIQETWRKVTQAFQAEKESIADMAVQSQELQQRERIALAIEKEKHAQALNELQRFFESHIADEKEKMQAEDQDFQIEMNRKRKKFQELIRQGEMQLAEEEAHFQAQIASSTPTQIPPHNSVSGSTPPRLPSLPSLHAFSQPPHSHSLMHSSDNSRLTREEQESARVNKRLKPLPSLPPLPSLDSGFMQKKS